MTDPIRTEFSESYISIRMDNLYAWWQVDHPETVRIETCTGGPTLVINRADLITLAEYLKP